VKTRSLADIAASIFVWSFIAAIAIGALLGVLIARHC
jgi:hypothetical protein